MRWTRGRLLVGVSASMLMIAGLVVPGDPALAARRPADLLLNYTCRFPAGERQVQVRIQGAFPEAVPAGRSTRPLAMSVALLLPPPAVADLTALGAARAGMALRLTTVLTAPGVAEDIVYRAPTAGPVPLDATGTTIPTTGRLPAIPAADPGSIQLSAGDLALHLTVRKPGDATKSATLSLGCSPYLGQDTTIAAIKAAEPRSGTGGGAAPAIRGADVRAADLVPYCNKPEVPGGYDPTQPMVPNGFNPKWPFPPLPAGTTVADYSFFSGPAQWCTDVVNYSNVRKLKGAARVQGLGSVRATERFAFPMDPVANNHLETDSILQSHMNPNRATFLGFGFVPTTATIEVVQPEVANVFVIGPVEGSIGYKPVISTAYAEVTLRMRDAEVNGAPLNVGPNCRTADPMLLKVEGDSSADPAYLINEGGVLSGYVTIPPFTGCGVGEDLDPLITAAVSGPGNYVRIIQGPACWPGVWPPPDQLTRPNEGWTVNPCPPRPFGFNVSPGGNWTATSTNFALGQFGDVKCGTVTMGGTMRRGKGLDGVRIAKITRWEARDCTGTDLIGTPLGSFNVTARNLPWDVVFDTHNPGPGPDGQNNAAGTHGHLVQPALRVTGPGCAFDMYDRASNEGQGPVTFLYDDETGGLMFGQLAGEGILNTPASFGQTENITGCETPIGIPLVSEGPTRLTDVNAQVIPEFTLSPRQSVTVPPPRPNLQQGRRQTRQ
jgi:uncharacterized protein DUF6801